MALVERLMHWGRFEGVDTEPPAFEPPSRWIAVHLFFAANHELLQGNLTAAQIKSFLEMTAADEVDYDAMVSNVQNVTLVNQTDERLRIVEQYHSAFILAEARITQYDTPAAVRTKLGI